jgi:multicomponent Na+:H+ antiporter subunit A
VAPLIIAHFVAAAALVAFARGQVLGRRAVVFGLAAVVPFVTFVWLGTVGPGVLDGGTLTASARWVPGLGLDFALRLDAFALLMALLVSGVGTLVFIYSARYFSDRPDLGRFAGTLLAFAGAMLGLVLSDDLFTLFLFWELTSITSYLLIGFDDTKAAARSAALQALLITGGGGLAMLAGFVLLSIAAGTSSLSAILSAPPDGTMVSVAMALVLCGAVTKSAQFPASGWLPGAMAAPTPVSSYLHSATMVKAGIYLVARFSPAFAPELGWWRPVVVTIGVITMFAGSIRALRQVDLKLLLAHGTVSQLGLLFILFGMGTGKLAFAGAAMLLAHAVFKAALFLSVGVIDHSTGTRDLRRLDRLRTMLPAVAVVAVAAALSMAAIPPLFGFVAKEAGLAGLLLAAEDGITIGAVALGAVVLGAGLTVAYTARFAWGAFGAKAPGELQRDRVVTSADVHRPGVVFLAPAALLAALGVVFGLVPSLVSPLVDDAAKSLAPSFKGAELKLWAGVNLPLLLSGVGIAIGAALWALRRQVGELLGPAPVPPRADVIFGRGLSGLLRSADRITGVVQSGSLPVYLIVVMGTVLVLPGLALVLSPPTTWLPDGALSSSLNQPLQLAAAAFTIAAAFACARTRRRFAAALLLGAVGTGMTVLFLLQGAPDLALTQFSVETLSVLVFLLVLRRLPSHFPPPGHSSRRYVRPALSIGVGVFFAAIGLAATANRAGTPSVAEYVARADADAGGRNIVNVIIVDFRGIDTLGEIVVLAVAAIGIASLLATTTRRRRRNSTADDTPGADDTADVDDAAAPTAEATT